MKHRKETSEEYETQGRNEWRIWNTGKKTSEEYETQERERVKNMKHRKENE